MSDTYSAHSRQNSQGDFEFFDPVSGTSLLAFRGPSSSLNVGASGVAQLDLTVAPSLALPASLPTYTKVIVPAASVLTLSGTPVTLLPAPGAGLTNFIMQGCLFLNHVTTAFAAGSGLQIIQNSIVIATSTAALINNASSIMIPLVFPGTGTAASAGAANSATTMNVVGSNFTGGGTSTLEVFLWYATIATP